MDFIEDILHQVNRKTISKLPEAVGHRLTVANLQLIQQIRQIRQIRQIHGPRAATHGPNAARGPIMKFENDSFLLDLGWCGPRAATYGPNAARGPIINFF